MSEYQCQEPGCSFHIGIGGELSTAEDYEQQEYYENEIEEHIRSHDDDPQPVYWVKVAPGVASWLDLAGLLEAHQNRIGVEIPNPFHVPGRLISDVVRSPFAGIASEGDSVSVPVDSAGVSRGDVVSENIQKVRIRLELITAGGTHSRIRGDVESDCVLRAGTDFEIDFAFRVMDAPKVYANGESSDHVGCCGQGEMPVDLKPGFHSSLSEGNTSVGTSESTERDQTPSARVKVKPSAGATAEGDETKTKS
ncbi:hypothetical protein ACT3UD_17005 [Glutamicibacter sp. 287]|uniref:hypothetical protein n=1 Tax=unclassified Glutamicibacter TaxID=2627139 RepID=UPI004034C9AE